MNQQSQLQDYFDALINQYNAIQSALETNLSRGSGSVIALEQEIAGAQREALELSKKVVAEASNPAAVYAALTSAAVASSTRALNFARIAYEQAAQSGSDASKQVEDLTKAAQQLNEAAAQFTSDWTSAGPFADLWQKTAEAFTPAAPKTAKK